MSTAPKLQNIESSEVLATASDSILKKLTKVESSNLAIQRLRSRVLAKADPSQVITCYDRMHHKHNRS